MSPSGTLAEGRIVESSPPLLRYSERLSGRQRLVEAEVAEHELGEAAGLPGPGR